MRNRGLEGHRRRGSAAQSRAPWRCGHDGSLFFRASCSPFQVSVHLAEQLVERSPRQAVAPLELGLRELMYVVGPREGHFLALCTHPAAGLLLKVRSSSSPSSSSSSMITPSTAPSALGWICGPGYPVPREIPVFRLAAGAAGGLVSAPQAKKILGRQRTNRHHFRTRFSRTHTHGSERLLTRAVLTAALGEDVAADPEQRQARMHPGMRQTQPRAQALHAVMIRTVRRRRRNGR
jgi:hypothetical protein